MVPEFSLSFLRGHPHLKRGMKGTMTIDGRVVRSRVIQAVQNFHYRTHYYSEGEDCPALDMGDGRGTYDKTSEVWTPLTDEQANVYWAKCDCGLKETIEGLI